MKKDLFCLIISFLLFLIILLLTAYVLKQKRIIDAFQENSFNTPLEETPYNNLMAKAYFLNSIRITDKYLLTPERDSVLLTDLLDNNEKIIILLSQNVCLPCAERFFKVAGKYYHELMIDTIIIIVEIANLRQINLMLNNYSNFKHVYFSQDYLLPYELFIEKPCLFLLDRNLTIKNTFIYDDFLSHLLYEWLKVFKTMEH